MVALALSELGYEVVVSDGRDILSLGSDFDVVLLDVRLRDRTAGDVLAAAPLLAERPLVVMTAAHESVGDLGELPDHSLLAKPFDLSDLEATVEAVRRRSS